MSLWLLALCVLPVYHPYQAGSSLVIINLPDPPVLSREQAEGADPKQLAALQLEQVSACVGKERRVSEGGQRVVSRR